MKVKSVVGIVLLMSAVISCSKLKERPVIDFAMKDFKKESSPGCIAESAACASFEVQYPRFMGIDSTVQHSIDDKVNFILAESTGEPKPLDLLAGDFIRDFNQFVKEMPDYGLGWYFRGKVQVLISSDTLISLQIDTESFTGGAHASYTTNFVNVDPKTGTNYLLDAMLRTGYQDELNRLGEEDFRTQAAGTENDSLGFAFPDGKFQLNENYGFRKEGIVFYFNDYEIASYEEGPTEILIPYEKLEGWIRGKK